MSGDRTSPRFDVVASTRRSWSREQKQAIVAEVEVPGASVSQVARRHGVHASLLFRWRRDLQATTPASAVDNGGSASASPPARGTAPAPAQHFVPIMLPPPDARLPAKPSTIEIEIRGGRTVRVGADVDTAALVRIIAALETGR
ncbi:MAG: IS66-like element accessory protein TnpA [Rhodomicrobium sp.]